jgi:hypothetical protein
LTVDNIDVEATIKKVQELIETVKVFFIIPLFSKEGLGEI